MSVRFNATADRVSRAFASSLPASNSLTFFCFAKLLSTTNAYNCFFSIDDGGNYTLLETNDNAGHSLAVYDGPGNDAQGGNMTVGDWYAIGYSSNGTTLRLWMKNLTAGTATVEYTGAARATNVVASGWTMYIGGNGLNEITSCDIRSPMIYRAAWSQTDFDAQVSSLSPVSSTNIDSWFTMEDNGATAMTDDQSANGRDLTRGASTWETDTDPPVGSSVSMSGSATLAGMTGAGTVGAGASMSASSTFAGMTGAAQASHVVASGAATLAGMTGAASVAHGVSASASATLAGMTGSGTLDHTPSAVTLSGAVTLAGMTGAASVGVGAGLSGSAVLAGMAGAGQAIVQVSATGSATFAGMSGTASMQSGEDADLPYTLGGSTGVEILSPTSLTVELLP